MKIRDEFQTGKTDIEINAIRLSDLGNRQTTYSGYINYRFGTLVKNTDAAPIISKYIFPG